MQVALLYFFSALLHVACCCCYLACVHSLIMGSRPRKSSLGSLSGPTTGIVDGITEVDGPMEAVETVLKDKEKP